MDRYFVPSDFFVSPGTFSYSGGRIIRTDPDGTVNYGPYMDDYLASHFLKPIGPGPDVLAFRDRVAGIMMRRIHLRWNRNDNSGFVVIPSLCSKHNVTIPVSADGMAGELILTRNSSTVRIGSKPVNQYTDDDLIDILLPFLPGPQEVNDLIKTGQLSLVPRWIRYPQATMPSRKYYRPLNDRVMELIKLPEPDTLQPYNADTFFTKRFHGFFLFNFNHYTWADVVTLANKQGRTVAYGPPKSRIYVNWGDSSGMIVAAPNFQASNVDMDAALGPIDMIGGE